MLSAKYKICPGCHVRAGADAHFCSGCGADVGSVPAKAGDPYVGLVLAEKYVVERLIGEGAMGRVYKAKQLTLGKPFAIKILAPHLMNDDASHARFANEAHNAASLNHPNCVSVLDYGRSSDGVTYIVMDYIEGMTLERIISEQFPLKRDRIIDLALQVLAALSEAHGLGILHRDLKPENILIQQLRTHGELAKVLDFGIAKLMEDETSTAKGLTVQGLVCGTPEYMSPEQARGHKLDARSDLYAVGAILYQMLTGRPPFQSDSAVEVLHKHLHETPVPPSILLHTAHDPLEDVCLRALQKDAAMRFESAAAFREALIAASAPRHQSGHRCTRCGSEMRLEHRFCPSCGAPSAQRVRDAGARRHSSRRSGMMFAVRGEPTAEVVVRSFPLPLAGREELLESLKVALLERKPTVDVRVFAGPRGIGKTRVGDEIAAVAEQIGWRTFYVGSDPSGARTPLWPIQCMVAQLLGVDPLTVTTRDLGRVANLCGLAFEELPGLAELFELHGPAYELEYGVRRRECFASSVQALLKGGRGQPLLLIFDDLDAYDSPSREIVRRLARSEAEVPVLALCMSAEERLDWLSDDVEHLSMLGADAVERLGRQATIEVNPTSKLPAALAAVAPLSPFKLENHLRLIASGLQAPGDATEEQLVQLRLADHDEAGLAVLELAAVLGERFLESDLVDIFHRAYPGRFFGSELDEALSRLHIEGLLVVTGNGERAFSHRILHEVAYASVDPARRRTLHGFAARMSGLARNQVTVRAVHLLRAGLPEAVQTLAEAAVRAERRFDDEASTEYLTAALEASSLVEAPEQRDAVALELALLAGRVMRGREAGQDAISLIDASLERDPTPSREAELLIVRGEQLRRLGRFDEASTTLKKAIAPAITAGEPALMVRIYSELGRTHIDDGAPDRALAELREGLDMFTLGEGPRAEVEFDLWRYLLRLADFSRRTGDLKSARTWCDHALQQAERRNSRLGLLRCHAQMAWILRDLRQLALAEQHLARALDEARYFGDRLTTTELLIERARARAARGRLTEALRCCEEALRLARGLQWAVGVEHAERAIAMLTHNQPPPSNSAPAERSGIMPVPSDN